MCCTARTILSLTSWICVSACTSAVEMSAPGTANTIAGNACDPAVGEGCGITATGFVRLACVLGKWSVVQVCKAGSWCDEAALLSGSPTRTTACVDAETADASDVDGDVYDVGYFDTGSDGLGGDAKDGTDVMTSKVCDPDLLHAKLHCSWGEFCNISTSLCEDLDCYGECAGGQKCNKSTGKCYSACGGMCSADQFCDETNAVPGVCEKFAAVPSKWGIDGEGKVQKVTSMAIAATTEGCDLDGDGKTDNRLGKIAGLMGDSFSLNIEHGSIVLLFEPTSYATDGTVFGFNLLYGDVDPAVKTPDFDATAAGGKYVIRKEWSYDPVAGAPFGEFSAAKINNGTLTANASSCRFLLDIGNWLFVTVLKPSITGKVTDAGQWATTTKGTICGHILKTDLESAINAENEWGADGLGMTKAQVMQLFPNAILAPDLDLDGDGVKESISLALNFETKSGTITGYSK